MRLNCHKREAHSAGAGVLAVGVLLALGAALVGVGVHARPGASGSVGNSPKLTAPLPANRSALAAGKFDHLPLVFEANQGQAASPVKFLSRGAGYGLFLTPEEAVLVLPQSTGKGLSHRDSVLRMSLASAQQQPALSGTELLPGKSNYFIGNDPSRWHQGVPQFARVQYHHVYRGIDLTYYGRQGQLEYDFEVAPGADPAAIALRFQNSDHAARKPGIAENGDLLLATGAGDVRLQAPRVYQKFPGEERQVAAKFIERADGNIGFALGEYDRSRELVIDPVLTYSTYLGGSGAESCSTISGRPFTPRCPAIAVDSGLSLYIAGSTTSTDFPVAAGGTVPTLAGTANVFVSKFDSTGSSLIYTTYIGGSGVDTTAGLAVDSGFDAFVAGTTTSPNLPTIGAFQSSPKAAGTHAFVTKLGSSGSNILYSTYLSGSGTDSASGMALDSQAKVYIIGTTNSSADFPTTAGAYETVAGCPPVATTTTGTTCVTPTGVNQFFISKLDPTLTGTPSLTYSTYFGGSNPATGVALGGAIAVDASSNVYITGGTNFLQVGTQGTDFPILNAMQSCLDTPEATAPTTALTCSTALTATDAFVAKLNIASGVANGSQLQYSTFVGGTGDDVGYGIAVDTGGSAYITGSTTSGDFTIPTGTIPVQAGNAGGSDAFVGKITAFTPPATTSTVATSVSLIYFSYLGGSGNDTGTGIAVDTASNARVTGWTDPPSGPEFPVQSAIAGTGTRGGGRDAFIANLNTVATSACVPAPTATPPVFCPGYSFFLGGTGTDMGTAILLDGQGGTYVAGETASGTGFPLQNPLQAGLNGPSDAFVTKLGPIVSLGLTAGSSPSPVGVGSPVTFTYNITNLGDFVTGVTFTDVLPTSGASFTSATASNGSCGSVVTGGTLQCNLGSLNTTASGATGATVTVILTPTAAATSSPTPPQPIGNSGTISVSGSTFQKTASATATVNDFGISASPASASVVAGAPASYTIQVSPTGGFPGAVALSVGSGLPTGATAAFSTTPIPNLNNGPVSTVLTINTTARVTTTVQRLRHGGPFYAFFLPVGGLAFLGFGVTRKRRALGLLALASFLTLIFFQASCGTKSATTTTTGTPAGTYTLTVNAASGSATRTTTVQLVVQ